MWGLAPKRAHDVDICSHGVPPLDSEVEAPDPWTRQASQTKKAPVAAGASPSPRMSLATVGHGGARGSSVAAGDDSGRPILSSPRAAYLSAPKGRIELCQSIKSRAIHPTTQTLIAVSKA